MLRKVLSKVERELIGYLLNYDAAVGKERFASVLEYWRPNLEDRVLGESLVNPMGRVLAGALISNELPSVSSILFVDFGTTF